MFMLFQDARWLYLLLSQSTLRATRLAFEARTNGSRLVTTAETARGDDLGPTIQFAGDTAAFWGVTLPTNVWHPDFPELTDGPGTRPQASAR